LLYGLEQRDPLTLVGSVLTFAGVGEAAALLTRVRSGMGSFPK